MTEDKANNEKRYEFMAKRNEAELLAIKSSKAYKAMNALGKLKKQVKSDPVGTTKRVARIILKEPKKVIHTFRTVKQKAITAQNVAEQTNKYQEWILLNEPDDSELDMQRSASEEFKYRPLISIVTPVFNPPIDVFEELIESVLEQTYTNFELCLGNFGDDKPVADMIARYADLDSRIKNLPFSDNKGIGHNSNKILEKSNGDFIALLDHDDTISPDALYENVKLLNEYQYDFIYSDKDKIDDEGNRFDPLFKPKLSPEMLLNVNYLTHLNLMRTDLVRKIGGWDPETDGAQDWDLFLRVIAESNKVAHIPKILYHWRVIATSTAFSIETKPYALLGQCRAIDKYLNTIGVKGKAYINKTELLIDWDKSTIDESPIVYVFYSNLANTTRVIRCIRKEAPQSEFIILLEKDKAGQVDSVSKHSGSRTYIYEENNLGSVISRSLSDLKKKHNGRTALFLIDGVKLPKKSGWYAGLTGWLNIGDVAATSGRLINHNDLIVSSGGLITQDQQYFPIFHNFPRYYQSYIGNAEWVRNLSILSPIFWATTLDHLESFNFSGQKDRESLFDNFFLSLAKKHRLVMIPSVTAVVHEDKINETVHNVTNGSEGKGYIDPYNNICLSPTNPMRLFEDEVLSHESNQEIATLTDYQNDATILAGTYDISKEQMMANNAIVSNRSALKNVKSVAFILPSFDGIYAGLTNIFSFAEYLNSKQKLKVTIYILKAGKTAIDEKNMAVAMFPSLEKANFVALLPAEFELITPHDIGIATLWATAYPLAKSMNIARKCYFIQDNETNFYPKGSISSLVELSYRFGFTAIANTQGLLDLYSEKYNGHGIVLKSKVDLSAYYPRADKYYQPSKPYKVFFYARPNMPRNAFELGIESLKKLKLDMGNDIEIITAGASWDSSVYGVQGMFTNLGKITYSAVPKLYRSVDAGLMFMFSGHPGVTASELMASGCPVVVNEYDDTTWRELYRDGQTAVVSISTASEVARNLKRCLTDQKLRKTLIDGGIEVTSNFYEGYSDSLDEAYKAIIS